MKWRGPLSGHGPQAESRVSRCDLPRPESRRPARADLLGQCGSPALRRSDAGAETAPKAFGETRLSQPPFERRAESLRLGFQRGASSAERAYGSEGKQSPEVQASRAHRTRLWLPGPADERILPALPLGGGATRGQRGDQPDLQ